MTLFWISAGYLNAQNLVPNPSFEEYSGCPTGLSNIDSTISWVSANAAGSPDYFNICSDNPLSDVPTQSFVSYQQPHTGEAYAAIDIYSKAWTGVSDVREYIQVKLIDTLAENQCYFVSFYVSHINCTGIGSNNLAVHFSMYPIYNHNPFPFFLLDYPTHVKKFGNPVIIDTANWTLISGLYSASGNETFMTIGNFEHDTETTFDFFNPSAFDTTDAWYYIDDVSVVPVETMPELFIASAGNDTTIYNGDSVFIGRELSGLNCNWFENGDPITNSLSGMFVSPMNTTTYVVEQNLCGVLSYDTVIVNVLPSQAGLIDQQQYQYSIYPNPFSDKATLKFNNFERDNHTLTVFDVHGKTISLQFGITGDSIELDRKKLLPGLYFFEIANNEHIVVTGKFLIN